MTAARICIITPGALASNPRVVKEADALAGAGYDVHVISTRTVLALDAHDVEITAKAQWSSVRLDLLDRLSRLHGIARQRVSRTLFELFGYQAAADLAYSAFTDPLLQQSIKMPAELYIAHYPPALPAAALAARHNRASFAYDAEDFHLGDLPPGPKAKRANTILETLEHRYLHDAAYVTASSPEIAKAYGARYQLNDPVCILNAHSITEVQKTEIDPAPSIQHPSIYWFSQVIGPNRGLELLVAAVSLSRAKPHLYLRGTVVDDFDQVLRQSLGDQYADHLVILPRAASAEMTALAAAHDLGYSGEPGHTLNNTLALGNKIFTYLLAGTPMLLSNVTSHVDFARQLGEACVLFDRINAVDLARAIDQVLLDPAALAAAKAKAKALGAQKYNWEQEAPKLLACVKEALAGHV